MWPLLLYPQHFIFVVICKFAQYAQVLDNTMLERLAKDKHFSLLGPFIIYEEN